MENSMDFDLSHLEIKDRKRSSGQLDCVSTETDKTDIMPRRSTRKRIRPSEPMPIISQIRTRSKKLTTTSNLKEIENYYLDKTVKLSSPALETIFEEPKDKKSVMSIRKFKRSINFNEDPSATDKLKVKKRTMKAKKVSVKIGTIIKKDKNLGMNFLLDKLQTIEDSKDEQLTFNK